MSYPKNKEFAAALKKVFDEFDVFLEIYWDYGDQVIRLRDRKTSFSHDVYIDIHDLNDLLHGVTTRGEIP